MDSSPLYSCCCGERINRKASPSVITAQARRTIFASLSLSDARATHSRCMKLSTFGERSFSGPPNVFNRSFSSPAHTGLSKYKSTTVHRAAPARTGRRALAVCVRRGRREESVLIGIWQQQQQQREGELKGRKGGETRAIIRNLGAHQIPRQDKRGEFSTAFSFCNTCVSVRSLTNKECRKSRC